MDRPLAALLYAQGRHREAAPIFQRALETKEHVLGVEHSSTLTSLNNLASLYKAQGHYEEAESLHQRALAIRERVLGTEHPDTLQSINNLATLYHDQGHYGKAKPLYERALVLCERVLGAEHPNTLSCLNNLAVLYQAQGYYGKTEPLHRRALATSERMLGTEHPNTLGSLNNLAELYRVQGRYGEAEPLLQRVLASYERALGSEHPDTLTGLNGLAVLYGSQGRYGEAEPLLKRVLVTRERVLGENYPDTLNSLNNLAELYRHQGRYGEAELLHQRALVAREDVLGAEHPDTLIPLNNLAELYRVQARHGEAEPLYQRALATRKRMLGVEHPNTLRSLNNLATLYYVQGRYRKAEPFYQRTLAARKHVLGTEHPDTLSTQLKLAGTYINNRKSPLALQELRRMDASLQGFVNAQLDSTLSEKVRRQWLQSQSTFQHAVFTLGVAEIMPTKLKADAMALAADVLLRWQRLAGESEALIAHLARVSEDPKVRELSGRLAEARAAWSRLVNVPEPNPKAIADARTRVEEMEVQLAGLSREFKAQRTNRSLEWRQVAAALPSGSALLCLRSFQPVDFKTGDTDDPRWLALLIPAAAKDESAIILKDLGPAGLVAEAFARLGATESEEDAQALYALLFGELDGELAQYETLYLAPDGMLDLVAFARLVLPDGRYWVQRQRLRQVRAGRDLVGRASTMGEPAENPSLPSLALGPGIPCRDNGKGSPTHLVAFGGIDYNEFPTATVAERSRGTVADQPLDSARGPSSSVANHGSAPLTNHGSTTGGSRSNVLMFPRGKRSTPATPNTPTNTPPPMASDIPPSMNQHLREAQDVFSPLPATRPEVAAIVRMYKQLTNHRVKVYTRTRASDYRLQHLPEPPYVLHLATHGFFLEERSERTDRPMTLGGLALAGANRGIMGETGPDGEDGILYALEAQNLNLEGTELVVLSACDTGKGEVDYSEGVYGLTRAFRTAGARNILMTLWPLNDALAAQFMLDFYENWLSGDASTGFDSAHQPPLGNHASTGGSRPGCSTPATHTPTTPAEALHKTRLAWIGSEDKARRNPRYWAPYVLIE